MNPTKVHPRTTMEPQKWYKAASKTYSNRGKHLKWKLICHINDIYQPCMEILFGNWITWLMIMLNIIINRLTWLYLLMISFLVIRLCICMLLLNLRIGLMDWCLYRHSIRRRILKKGFNFLRGFHWLNTNQSLINLKLIYYLMLGLVFLLNLKFKKRMKMKDKKKLNL